MPGTAPRPDEAAPSPAAPPSPPSIPPTPPTVPAHPPSIPPSPPTIPARPRPTGPVADAAAALDAELARPGPPAVDPPMLPFAIGGTVAWAIATLVMLPLRDSHDSWFWICVAGLLWGVPGVLIMLRHDQRLVRHDQRLLREDRRGHDQRPLRHDQRHGAARPD